MERLLLLALTLMLLTACGGLQPQVDAARTKDSNIVCAKASGPWGAATTTYVNVDKGVVVNGTVTTDAECKVTFSNVTGTKAP